MNVGITATEEHVSYSEFKRAIKEAKRKLALIIEREGDLNGERLKPQYIAQLTLEILHANRFSNYCLARTREIKKEMPVAEATRQI